MIAEATIREALTEPPPAGSLFEACVEAVNSRAGYTEYGPAVPPSLAPDLARAVIQTIIDLTPSPRAVDELTRILGEMRPPCVEGMDPFRRCADMTRIALLSVSNSAAPQPRGHPWFPRPTRWGATETIIEGWPDSLGDGGTWI